MSDENNKNRRKVMARGRTLSIGGVGQNETPAVIVGYELMNEGGGSITGKHFLTPGAEEFTVKALQAMGWEGNDIEECEALMEAGKLSKVVELVLEDRTYNGKTYPEIKFVNAVGGGAKRLSGGVLQDVKDRIKMRIGEVARFAPSNGTPPPAAPPAASSSQRAPDDDIPFATVDAVNEHALSALWSRLP